MKTINHQKVAAVMVATGLVIDVIQAKEVDNELGISGRTFDLGRMG